MFLLYVCIDYVYNLYFIVVCLLIFVCLKLSCYCIVIIKFVSRKNLIIRFASSFCRVFFCILFCIFVLLLFLFVIVLIVFFVF